MLFVVVQEIEDERTPKPFAARAVDCIERWRDPANFTFSDRIRRGPSVTAVNLNN